MSSKADLTVNLFVSDRTKCKGTTGFIGHHKTGAYKDERKSLRISGISSGLHIEFDILICLCHAPI